jgi:hypothetical protein
VNLRLKGITMPAAILALVMAPLTQAFGQTGHPLPRIEGQSFAGQELTLPHAASGKIALLIFGFSKGSSAQTGAWGKKISADFGTRPGFALYQLPVLEDVPRLFRGMVISGIKKGVPENQRERFIPVLQGEAELKRDLQFSESRSDDAYLVLLDRNGRVLTEFHGPPNDPLYSQTKEQIEQLLK